MRCCAASMRARANPSLASASGMNDWPPKPGIHRHDQHQIELVDRVVEPVERGRRVEHEARLAAAFADEPDRAIDVLGGLRVKAHDRCARLREIGDDAVDGLHHQVDVDRDRRLGPQRLADQRPDCQIGNVMVVHHVEVEKVGAGGDHRPHFVAQSREIRGEQRRRDSVIWHGFIIGSGNVRAMPMGETRKYEITVATNSAYLADKSDPSRNQYVFAYTITITNTGAVAAQLISRHWIITDAEQQVQEVKGLGVVGQQPLLQPGRALRVHERHEPPHGGRHHARHLPDGRRGRHGIRRRHPALHAFHAAGAALAGGVSRGSFVAPREGFRVSGPSSTRR